MKTETTEETGCELHPTFGMIVKILDTVVKAQRDLIEILKRHEETLKKHSELLNERSAK